jgi:plasmid stabilization system protein ParE
VGQVVWSPQALEDVDAICGYVGRDAPRFAAVFAERIFAAVDDLKSFPRSGRMVPEIGRDDYREVIFQSYRIIYRLLGPDVEVVTVHHGARLFGGTERASTE